MYFLEYDTVGLRLLTVDDVEGSYKDWFNDAKICQYNSHHKFPMYKQDLIDYINSLSGDHSQIVLAVEEKSTGTHIGNVSLQNIDYINRQCEIAFIIGDEKFWGRGYASRAGVCLIKHAFETLNMNRIYFGTADNNIGMQKVGEKLHFKKEGQRRQALYKNGEYHDVYEYSLLREEWDNRKSL